MMSWTLVLAASYSMMTVGLRLLTDKDMTSRIIEINREAFP